MGSFFPPKNGKKEKKKILQETEAMNKIMNLLNIHIHVSFATSIKLLRRVRNDTCLKRVLCYNFAFF